VKLPINIVSDPVSVHPPVMRQIPVGPELDAAVARAVGYDLPSYQDGRCSACDREYGWRPSIDLNAAFEAAEKALRSEYGDDWWHWFDLGLATGINGVEWRCTFIDRTAQVFCSTPAEAICRAILALKGAE
jgi:hypothetical protein